MSIVGALEQLPFTEFVQTLANLERTGKLSVSRFGERGTIFLRDGKIIGAASSSVRETLGSLLVSQWLISRAQLLEAVETQRTSSDGKRLGDILVEQGALSERDLRQAVRQQTQRVVQEFMRWKHGFFEFEALDIVDQEEIEIDILEMFLGEGLSAEGVLLAGAIDIDEASPENAAVGEAQGTEGIPPEGEFDIDEMLVVTAENDAKTDTEVTERPGSVARLRDLLLEVRSPEFTGELMAKILEYSAGIFPRCVLFSVQGGYFCGMSYNAAEPIEQSIVERVRAVRIPIGEPSILAEAAARLESCQGRLRNEPNNTKIVECLGGAIPEKGVAIPIMAHGRVLMVLYGDSGAVDRSIGSTAELELLMLQVGLLMESDPEDADELVVDPDSTPSEDDLESDDFRSLLDSDPEPIVLLDPNSRILYLNSAMEAILGESADAKVGSSLLTGVHPEDRSDLQEVVLEVSRGGAPGGNTVRFREADGTWRRCYLLPSAIGVRSGDRCVMLRALTAGEIRGRFDPLTGLMEHEAFVDRLERGATRSGKEGGEPFALLMLGLDDFTLINVEFGWAVGNQLLRSIGHRLTLNLRPADVVSRGGGDRFCVMLDKLRASEDGLSVAERIVEFLDRPFEVAGRQVKISVSVGVVTSGPVYQSADKILEDAATAMLAAKRERGNSIVVHGQEGSESALHTPLD